MPRLLFIIIPFLILITSCTPGEKPLTKEEAMAFGKKIELSISKGHNKMLDEAIDEKALLKKMDLKSGKDARSFLAGLRQGMKMGTKITEALSDKGTYSLIKHYEKDKVHHILYRLYDGGMINYHDYELRRTKGEPKVVDMYIYMTGENLSETLRTFYYQFKDNYGESSTKLSGWIKKMPEIRSLITAGKHQQALDIYNSVPEEFQKGRLFQIVHMEICSGLEEDEYAKAIEEYQSLYPNEPNMQLMLIDGHILHKDYDKALNAVNELDKMIDKDPLLDFHRAMCYTLMKDDEKRKQCLQRLVKNLPDFEDGILELIADYLEADEFEEARKLIVDFKTRRSFNQATLDMLLTRYPGYSDKYAGN